MTKESQILFLIPALSQSTCFSTLCPDTSWPKQTSLDQLGEIAGVDVDAYTNDVVVLHRGDRKWSQDNFNE